jgi:hypothetical protein
MKITLKRQHNERFGRQGATSRNSTMIAAILVQTTLWCVWLNSATLSFVGAMLQKHLRLYSPLTNPIPYGTLQDMYKSINTHVGYDSDPSSFRARRRQNILCMIQDENNSKNNKKINREIEIRRQIQQFKQQGKIKKTNDNDDNDNNNNDDIYRDKIRQKLGKRKSQLFGFTGENENEDNEFNLLDDDDDDDDDDEDLAAIVEDLQLAKTRRIGQIGALPKSFDDNIIEEAASTTGYQRQKAKTDDMTIVQLVDIDNDDDDDNEDSIEMSDEDLIDLVEQRLQQTTTNPTTTITMESTSPTTMKTTTGIGGSWDKNEGNVAATEDMYQPKTGSWGAFPRPRDISKAYGGGRRVGVGYTESVTSVDETRLRLQRYRATVGIDVESEKVNAKEIDDAIQVAAYAMQRGVYTSAVSALEKVTKYCSTNSKVGGKVFLELAMAYEAAGQTQEAITVYTTLSRSRNEEIASTAKRLLYGIEAIKFMQENVGSAAFSRQQAKMTFIDTTGLDNFARNFDDVYETSYIDLDNNYYKQLTEAVVRTSREARQILICATQPGEIGRLRIVQALRSLSRYFDDALQTEIELLKPLPEPVAVMDGKPIIPLQQLKERQQSSKTSSSDYLSSSSSSSRQFDEYVLMDPIQMIENLNGEWQLQLITDKRGDGVKFFNNNTSLVWQTINTNNMKFNSYCTQGIFSVEPNGVLDFNNKRRILRRRSIEMAGTGSMLTNILGGITMISKMGPIGAICTERQIVMVDSVLLVTRGVPNTITTTKFGTIITTRSSRKEDDKDYFAVWRRVETGTYSRQ